MFGLKSCLLGDSLKSLYSLKVPFVISMITFNSIKHLDPQLVACLLTAHGKNEYNYIGSSKMILNYADAVCLDEVVGKNAIDLQVLRNWTGQMLSKLIIMEQNGVIHGNISKKTVFLDKSNNIIFRRQFLFHLANYQFPVG
jgi:hypothetical protein